MKVLSTHLALIPWNDMRFFYLNKINLSWMSMLQFSLEVVYMFQTLITPYRLKNIISNYFRMQLWFMLFKIIDTLINEMLWSGFNILCCNTFIVCIWFWILINTWYNFETVRFECRQKTNILFTTLFKVRHI